MTTVTFDTLLSRGTYGKIYESSTPGFEDSVFKVFYDKHNTITCLELDCMFRLDHPNLMRGKDLFTIKNLPSRKLPCRVDLHPNGVGRYIVLEMEKAQCDLYTWRKTDHPYEEKIKIFFEILKGINFFHKCHLLHLDIKIENILVMKDGGIKITDFGMSIPINNHNRGRRYLRETVTRNYRPPENFDDKKDKDIHFYQQKTDVWSLGVLFATLLMPYNNGILIEDDQIPMIEHVFDEKRVVNFLATKFGRGLKDDQKKEMIPFLQYMLKLNPKDRLDVRTLLDNRVFKKRGLVFDHENMEGAILQPVFPPKGTTLTLEDYALKLEYFVFNFTKLIFYINKRYKDDVFPLQVLFLGADIFLRHRHLFQSSDEIMALAVYCATEISCDYEVEFEQLEEYYEVTKLDRRWRDLLFLNKDEENRYIMYPNTPFSRAVCRCRINYILDLLYKNPMGYVELCCQENFEDLSKMRCKHEPNWNVTDYPELEQNVLNVSN